MISLCQDAGSRDHIPPRQEPEIFCTCIRSKNNSSSSEAANQFTLLAPDSATTYHVSMLHVRDTAAEPAVLPPQNVRADVLLFVGCLSNLKDGAARRGSE